MHSKEIGELTIPKRAAQRLSLSRKQLALNLGIVFVLAVRNCKGFDEHGESNFNKYNIILSYYWSLFYFLSSEMWPLFSKDFPNFARNLQSKFTINYSVSSFLDIAFCQSKSRGYFARSGKKVHVFRTIWSIVSEDFSNSSKDLACLTGFVRESEDYLSFHR